jgi:hypothetical protein
MTSWERTLGLDENIRGDSELKFREETGRWSCVEEHVRTKANGKRQRHARSAKQSAETSQSSIRPSVDDTKAAAHGERVQHDTCELDEQAGRK